MHCLILVYLLLLSVVEGIFLHHDVCDCNILAPKCPVIFGKHAFFQGYPLLKQFKYREIKWLEGDYYEVTVDFRIQHKYSVTDLVDISLTNLKAPNEKDGRLTLYNKLEGINKIPGREYDFSAKWIMEARTYLHKYACSTPFNLEYKWLKHHAKYVHGCGLLGEDVPIMCWPAKCGPGEVIFPPDTTVTETATLEPTLINEETECETTTEDCETTTEDCETTEDYETTTEDCDCEETTDAGPGAETTTDGGPGAETTTDGGPGGNTTEGPGGETTEGPGGPGGNTTEGPGGETTEGPGGNTTDGPEGPNETTDDCEETTEGPGGETTEGPGGPGGNTTEGPGGETTEGPGGPGGNTTEGPGGETTEGPGGETTDDCEETTDGGPGGEPTTITPNVSTVDGPNTTDGPGGPGATVGPKTTDGPGGPGATVGPKTTDGPGGSGGNTTDGPGGPGGNTTEGPGGPGGNTTDGPGGPGGNTTDGPGGSGGNTTDGPGGPNQTTDDCEETIDIGPGATVGPNTTDGSGENPTDDCETEMHSTFTTASLPPLNPTKGGQLHTTVYTSKWVTTFTSDDYTYTSTVEVYSTSTYYMPSVAPTRRPPLSHQTESPPEIPYEGLAAVVSVPNAVLALFIGVIFV